MKQKFMDTSSHIKNGLHCDVENLT
eukprot:UN13112